MQPCLKKKKQTIKKLIHGVRKGGKQWGRNSHPSLRRQAVQRGRRTRRACVCQGESRQAAEKSGVCPDTRPQDWRPCHVGTLFRKGRLGRNPLLQEEENRIKRCQILSCVNAEILFFRINLTFQNARDLARFRAFLIQTITYVKMYLFIWNSCLHT